MRKKAQMCINEQKKISFMKNDNINTQKNNEGLKEDKEMAQNYREPQIIFEGWTAPAGTGIIVTGAASGIGAATCILRCV